MKHIKLFESFDKNHFKEFLKDKEFENPKSKIFLFHGTNIHPDKFVLRDDYDGSDGNAWGADLPEGYVFMTTSLQEAAAYGQYVIPCEMRKYDHIFFKINANNPSQIFDDDYGISIIQHTKEHFGFWEKFEESGKSALLIKGTDRFTAITNWDNVIPRTDLAKEFYK